VIAKKQNYWLDVLSICVAWRLCRIVKFGDVIAAHDLIMITQTSLHFLYILAKEESVWLVKSGVS
jgi:hypothetical protein